MIFFEGLFRYSFEPVAILALFSIVIISYNLWKKKFDIYSIIFLMLFFFMSLWRIPINVSSRYSTALMPISILLSCIMCMFILQKIRLLNNKYQSAIRGLFVALLLIVFISGTLKALRVRDNKIQIDKFMQVVKNDLRNSQFPIILYQYGNIGGAIPFNEKIITYKMKPIKSNDDKIEAESAVTLNLVNIDVLEQYEIYKLYNPNIYFFIKESYGEDFKKLWREKTNDTLKEIFCIENSKRRFFYRLYKVENNPKFASVDAIKDFFKENNILENGDFSKLISSNKILENQLSLFAKRDFYPIAKGSLWPENWSINTNAGWKKDNNLAYIKINKGSLTLSSPTIISINSLDYFPANNRYLALLNLNFKDNDSILQLNLIAPNSIAKPAVIVSEKKDNITLKILNSNQFNSKLYLYLVSGKVEIKSIYVIREKDFLNNLNP